MPIIAGRASAAYGAGFAATIPVAPFELVGSFDFLSSVIVPSGGATSITFHSIPTGYKHLQIRYIGKGTSTSGGYPTSCPITLNGDATDSNYGNHFISGDGGDSAVAGGALSNRGNICVLPGSNGAFSSASLMGVGVIDILDYSDTSKNKTLRSLQGADANGSGQIRLVSMFYLSTSAITSILFTPDPTFLANIAQHSQFSLYGVR